MNFSTTNFSTIPGNVTINCTELQTFVQLDDFLVCYDYFASLDPETVTGQYVLIVGTLCLNLMLVFFVSRSPKLGVFDHILIGHSIVDFLTGLLDAPFYHIYDIFGYWPLGNILGTLWSSFDSNINTTSTLHMLYVSYARLRSIQNPQGYKFEMLLKRPYVVMGMIWAISLGIWLPLTYGFGFVPYTNNVNINPWYLVMIINMVTWLIPLTATGIVSVFVYVRLIIIINLTKSFLPKNLSTWRKYRIGTQFRFFFIIAPFFVQWYLISTLTTVTKICSPCFGINVSNMTSKVYYFLLHHV